MNLLSAYLGCARCDQCNKRLQRRSVPLPAYAISIKLKPLDKLLCTNHVCPCYFYHFFFVHV